MTNYTSSDFTDIRGPEKKPTVPGWYITDHCDVEKEFVNFHGGNSRTFISNGYPFTRWDGEDWRNVHGDLMMHGDGVGHWFGLKEKP